MEAVGVVLGVSSLIVEILKSNPGPIHALRALSRENANEILTDFYTDLQFEVSMLKITLTDLVNKLPISSELKKSMTDEESLDPTVWKNPPEALQDSLRRRLQHFTEPFKQCMDKILRLLARLVDDKSFLSFLASDQVPIVSETPYSKVEALLDAHLNTAKRMRLGWKKKERDDIMKGITKYNKKLQKMLERTTENRVSQIAIQPSCASEFVPHPGLRQKMNDLRNAFQQEFCRCTNRHELRLGLSRTLKDDDRVKVDMILNLSKMPDKWHWAESKICIHLKNSPSSSDMDAFPDHRDFEQQRRSSSSFSGTTVTESPKEDTRIESPLRPRRKTSVNEGPVESEQQEKTQCSDCLRHLGSPHKRLFFHEICTIVQHGPKNRKAAQFVFCQNKLWHNGTTTDTEVTNSKPGVGLDCLLQRGKMSMKDRKILQVLLAQSVLYFPWTGQNLTKSSIAFHHDMDKPFASLLLDQSDDSTLEIPGSLEIETATFDYKPYNNEMLAGLATTLLEIELEKRIEELQTAEDVGDGDSSQFDTNFWTSARVLKEQELNMYKGCYEAINACIKCDFDDGPPRLDNPTFLQKVYNRIVAPLEQELWNGFGHRIPYLEDPSLGKGVFTSVNVVQKWSVPMQQIPGVRKNVKLAENVLFDVPELYDPQRLGIMIYQLMGF